VTLCQTNKAFVYNTVMSGLTFYGYNELSTMTIKYTSAVTASVANTAKRVIVIVGVAIALGKPLTFEEKVGSAISISGVFLYSVADAIFGKKAKKA
jgi:solute carrier family 35 protein E1